MVKRKPLLSAAAIAPITAASEKQKENDDDKNKFHIFLQYV
jgi:hypothetical protein